MCEICPKLTIKTPERRHWNRFGVFIVNFEQISHIVLVFLNVGWEAIFEMKIVIAKTSWQTRHFFFIFH